MTIYINTYNEFDYYHSYLNKSLRIVNKWIHASYSEAELLELFDYIYDFMLIDNRYRNKYYTYSLDKNFPFIKKKTKINKKTFEEFVNHKRNDYYYPYYLQYAKNRLELLKIIFSKRPKNIFLCDKDLLLILSPEMWKEQQKELFREKEINLFLLYIKYGYVLLTKG